MGQDTIRRRLLRILEATIFSLLVILFWELHRNEAYGAGLTEMELSSEAIAQGNSFTPPESFFQDTSSSGFQSSDPVGTSASGLWTYDDPNLVAFSLPQFA